MTIGLDVDRRDRRSLALPRVDPCFHDNCPGLNDDITIKSELLNQYAKGGQMKFNLGILQAARERQQLEHEQHASEAFGEDTPYRALPLRVVTSKHGCLVAAPFIRHQVSIVGIFRLNSSISKWQRWTVSP